jgi:uncharacterized membrane protein YidH (DUF202 family)
MTIPSGAGGASGPEHIHDIEDADPGLAAERTELAWTRTAISFAAVGAALLRYHPVVGIPVLALSLLIWALGRLPGKPGSSHIHARRLQLIAAAVTAIALAALVITLVTGW